MITRTFLSLLLLVLSSVKLAFCGEHFSVIIVGAGISGIAASVKLLEHNITDFIILEADNRTGGRIHSVKFGDAFVDLGAEVCHGAKGNLVYELVKDYDVLRESPGSYKFAYSDGTRFEQDLEKDINEFYDTYLDINTTDSDVFLSAGEFFMKHYNRTIMKKYMHDKNKLKKSIETLRGMEQLICDYEGCPNWFDTPHLNQYDVSEGDQDLSWNGHGYQFIIDVITKAIPDPKKRVPYEKKVRFKKEVSKIKYRRNGSSVLVECEDGSQYSSKLVLFTPSLGILKENHVQLFEPELPDKKIDALECIGYGNLMKVILHFPDKWWDERVPDTIFVWKEEDKERIRHHSSMGDSFMGNESWLTNLYTVVDAGQNPNVLVCWFVGELVPQIEKLPKKTLLEGVMFVLETFLGRMYDVSSPDKMIYTTWHTNPHFRGTYSYETMTSNERLYDTFAELAKPLVDEEGKPRVLFAGEATSSDHYSTVHGALETGYREADNIIKLLH